MEMVATLAGIVHFYIPIFG